MVALCPELNKDARDTRLLLDWGMPIGFDNGLCGLFKEGTLSWSFTMTVWEEEEGVIE